MAGGPELFGIVGGFGSAALPNRIAQNTVREFGQFGIVVTGGSAGTQFTANVSTLNGTDCADQTTGSGTAGTASTWTGNTGATSPAGLCAPPVRCPSLGDLDNFLGLGLGGQVRGLGEGDPTLEPVVRDLCGGWDPPGTGPFRPRTAETGQLLSSPVRVCAWRRSRAQCETQPSCRRPLRGARAGPGRNHR